MNLLAKTAPPRVNRIHSSSGLALKLDGTIENISRGSYPSPSEAIQLKTSLNIFDKYDHINIHNTTSCYISICLTNFIPHPSYIINYTYKSQ